MGLRLQHLLNATVHQPQMQDWLKFPPTDLIKATSAIVLATLGMATLLQFTGNSLHMHEFCRFYAKTLPANFEATGQISCTCIMSP